MGSLFFFEVYGGKNDMGLYVLVFEILGYYDISLCIKFGVYFGLWGGSVLVLGIKKYYDKYLIDIGIFVFFGCFVMMEIGYGLNVCGFEIMVIYDFENDELIIYILCEEAGKEYIGNVFYSKVVSVFVQFIVGGENYGVYVVVVLFCNIKYEFYFGI